MRNLGGYGGSYSLKREDKKYMLNFGEPTCKADTYRKWMRQ
jgi:hypothetical protein